jgi:hypothetical protein
MEYLHKKIIFPTFLAPPLAYYRIIQQAEAVVVDLNETYIKQSLRNRYFIVSPNGMQRLVVPVIKTSGHLTKTKDLKIDYHLPWVQMHIRSLVTSYNKAPFFLYVWDELRACYEKKYSFLWELNASLNEHIFKWLNIKTPIIYSEDFIPLDENNPLDFRLLLKKDQHRPSFKVYYQPFSEKFGFTDGLSILDAIFCAGLEVRKWLL